MIRARLIKAGHQAVVQIRVGVLCAITLGLGTGSVAGCGPDASNIAEKYAQASRDFGEQKTGAARSAIDEILDLDPTHTNARILRGRIAYYDKKYDEAEIDFREAWIQDSSSIDALLWLARSQSLRTDESGESVPKTGPVAAIASLELLVEKDPGNTAAWYLLGTLYEGQGQIDRAIAAYRYGLVAGQNLGLIHVRLAELYGEADLIEQARPHLEAAAIFARSNPELQRRVAAARSAYLK